MFSIKYIRIYSIPPISFIQHHNINLSTFIRPLFMQSFCVHVRWTRNNVAAMVINWFHQLCYLNCRIVAIGTYKTTRRAVRAVSSIIHNAAYINTDSVLSIVCISIVTKSTQAFRKHSTETK